MVIQRIIVLLYRDSEKTDVVIVVQNLKLLIRRNVILVLVSVKRVVEPIFLHFMKKGLVNKVLFFSEIKRIGC